MRRLKPAFRVVYFGASTQSFHSLRARMDSLLAGDEPLPEMLPLLLSLDSAAPASARGAALKLMFAAVLNILRRSCEQTKVLFVCDDANLLHNECLGALGSAGHQVRAG